MDYLESKLIVMVCMCALLSKDTQRLDLFLMDSCPQILRTHGETPPNTMQYS